MALGSLGRVEYTATVGGEVKFTHFLKRRYNVSHYQGAEE